MITLTVDRSKWESAEQVHDHVTSNSLVPRLMKRLGLESWVGVLEFQKETGEGWPHWHVLCDWPGFVEFNEIRRLWWGLFGIGNIQVHVNKGKAGAVHYLCSYLNKITESTPAWLLARTKSVRRVSTSKAVGAVVREAMKAFREAQNGDESFEPETEKAVVVEKDQPTTKREKSALIWRISQCGTFSRVSKKHGGLEVPLGTLRCDSETVATAGKQGRIEIIRDNQSVVRIISPSDPFMNEVWGQLEKWDAENNGYPWLKQWEQAKAAWLRSIKVLGQEFSLPVATCRELETNMAKLLSKEPVNGWAEDENQNVFKPKIETEKPEPQKELPGGWLA